MLATLTKIGTSHIAHDGQKELPLMEKAAKINPRTIMIVKLNRI